MLLIKLDATDSTNAYLKDLLVAENPPDGTVVQAIWQQKGRGQFGRTWLSEPGKNLTFSILKKFEQLKVSDQFLLSMVTSLAIITVLKKHGVPDLQVKWPNDILSGKHKICGILVENMVKGEWLKASIIGIGLNVNQEDFPTDLSATSVKLETGKDLALDMLLQDITATWDIHWEAYSNKPFEIIRLAYEELLFRKGEQTAFTTPEGNTFQAKVMGIDPSGCLLLRRENGDTQAYALNEIRMVL